MNRQAADSTILVTGASGFLGSAVVAQLREQNCRLRTSGRRPFPNGNLPNYMPTDLRDDSAISQLVKGVDVVIHAAGLAHQHRPTPTSREEFFRINAHSTKTLLRAAVNAGCRRFVFVSSVSVYGNGPAPKRENEPCSPTGPYAQSKLEAEKLAFDVADSANIELIVLRMATLYGENDPGNVGRLLRAIEGGRFLWIGHGQNYKSLVHVDDAASACRLAAIREQTPPNRTFNVASEPHTMQEIVAILAEALGRRVPSRHLPARIPLAVMAAAAKVPGLANRARRLRTTLDKWISDDVFDASSFRDTFKWQSEVPLEAGLIRQVMRHRLNQRADNDAAQSARNCAA